MKETQLKPGLFQYVRAESIEDAISQIELLGDSASILAGGQSLVPTMALRMANPEFLIDISAIRELQRISVDSGILRIGAGCRYSDLLNSPDIQILAPLLAEAIPYIAHEAIRNRGTIGGSLVQADPASELPACMIALDATIVLRSGKGERRVAADAFFLGTYFTAMDEDELLVEVELPVIGDNQRHHFSEISRRSGDYAIAGGAFSLRFENGAVCAAMLVFFAVSDRPVLAEKAAISLIGKPLDDKAILMASDCVVDEIDFAADLHTGVAAKRQITRTLTRRLLVRFIDEVV